MCPLTPKISCATTSGPRGAPSGSARYADNRKPSAAVKSTQWPIPFLSSIRQQRREDPPRQQQQDHPFHHVVQSAEAVLQSLAGHAQVIDEAEHAIQPADLVAGDVFG